MSQHRFQEQMPPTASPDQAAPTQLPPGQYVLLPTSGHSTAQVSAIQLLYQMALNQTQPRRNFRWEQAHQPRWN